MFTRRYTFTTSAQSFDLSALVLVSQVKECKQTTRYLHQTLAFFMLSRPILSTVQFLDFLCTLIFSSCLEAFVEGACCLHAPLHYVNNLFQWFYWIDFREMCINKSNNNTKYQEHSRDTKSWMSDAAVDLKSSFARLFVCIDRKWPIQGKAWNRAPKFLYLSIHVYVRVESCSVVHDDDKNEF